MSTAQPAKSLLLQCQSITILGVVGGALTAAGWVIENMIPKYALLIAAAAFFIIVLIRAGNLIANSARCVGESGVSRALAAVFGILTFIAALAVELLIVLFLTAFGMASPT